MKKLLAVCILTACFIAGIILTYETPANSNQLNGTRLTSAEKQEAESKIESFLESNMAYFNPFSDQVRVNNCKITYRLNGPSNCDASPTARFNEFRIDLKDVRTVRIFENSRHGTGAAGSIRFEFTEEVQKRFDRAKQLFQRYNQHNNGYTGSMWAQEAYSAEQNAVKGAGLSSMRSYAKTQNCSRSVQQFHLPKTLGTISLSTVDRGAAYSLKNYHANCING
nr:hypothetical protein [uncultured Cohaesibacter sp.]